MGPWGLRRERSEVNPAARARSPGCGRLSPRSPGGTLRHTASPELPLKATVTFHVAGKASNSNFSFPEVLHFLDISFIIFLVVFSLPHTLSIFCPMLFL